MNAEDVAVGIAKPQETNEAVRAFVERMPYRTSAHATFVLACRLQGVSIACRGLQPGAGQVSHRRTQGALAARMPIRHSVPDRRGARPPTDAAISAEFA